MSRNLAKQVLFLYLAIFVMLLVASPLMALTGSLAPTRSLSQTNLANRTGFVPPQMDLDHLKIHDFSSRFQSPVALTRWDWREGGNVSSVKDQGACGACYAFAALACFESRVLIDSSVTYDFSENNAKECNWYGTSCFGGNFYYVASLLSQQGTVLESCDPYVAANVACNSTCDQIKTLLDWRVISSDFVPITVVLQNYIYNNGPVYTSMYAGNSDAWYSEFVSYDGSYVLHYTGLETPNHAVMIVGWDDTLSHAGGTGAWIVKNSWGTGWGGNCDYGSESGYFYIAYGSGSIGKYASFVNDWQDCSVGDRIYYYDEGGYTNSWGYGNTSGWGLCDFTPVEDAYLTRVEFWTNDITTDIDVYIYDDFDGSTASTLLAQKLNCSFTEAGYHSIALDSPPQILAGDNVYAVVKFTNSIYTYPIVIDGSGVTESGKTYVSSNGSSWYELGASQGYDVAIRVRTAPTLAVSADDPQEVIPFRFSLSNNYPNPFNPSTTIQYTVEHTAHVEISIYNLIGQKITTLVDEVKTMGEHEVGWDGRDSDGRQVPTGIYFYQLRAEDYAETKKMLRLK